MKEKSTRRRNSILAVIAGASLLAGGSTFALWQATSKVIGGSINTGDLNLEAKGAAAIYDVTAPYTDNQLPVGSNGLNAGNLAQDIPNLAVTSSDENGKIAGVDATDSLIVPRGVFAIASEQTMTLKGRHLVAKLTASLASDVKLPDYISLKFVVFNGADALTTSTIDLGTGETTLGFFRSTDAAASDVPGGAPSTVVNDTTGMDLTIVSFVVFDEQTPERLSHDELVELTNKLGFTLQQVTL